MFFPLLFSSPHSDTHKPWRWEYSCEPAASRQSCHSPSVTWEPTAMNSSTSLLPSAVTNALQIWAGLILTLPPPSGRVRRIIRNATSARRLSSCHLPSLWTLNLLLLFGGSCDTQHLSRERSPSFSNFQRREGAILWLTEFQQKSLLLGN